MVAARACIRICGRAPAHLHARARNARVRTHPSVPNLRHACANALRARRDGDGYDHGGSHA
eukprot:6178156-Pleurochrysis_carterae.AAC.3